MAGSLSSIFSSLGAAFHGFTFPVWKNVRSSSATFHHCKTSTHPDVFENRLATDLQHLNFSVVEFSYPSVRWLQQAVDAICLSAYSRAEQLFPHHIRQVLDLRKDCSKWVNKYLEDTISLLDICNVVRNRIARIVHCQQILQIAIHCLEGAKNPSEIQLWRARRALDNCLNLIDITAVERAELKKCMKSLLKRMGDRSAAPVSDASSSSVGEFVGVMNSCKAKAVFVCSTAVAALSFEPTKRLFPFLANKYMGHSGSWPSAFLNAQFGMKEEMGKGESKRRASALLVEVSMADEAARRLYGLLDQFVKSKSFPLTKDDRSKLRQSIAGLKKSSDDLKNVMVSFDKHISEMMRSIITCRMTLLDMLTYQPV